MNRIEMYLITSVLLTAGVVGCTASPSPAVPKNTAVLSPKQVVQYYYKSLNQHDFRDAKQFMSPKLIAFYHSTAYGLNNIRSVRHLTVSLSSNEAVGGSDKVQVVASFSAKYNHVGGTTNGPQTRFLSLSRNNSKQPWLIQSIGSGP